ncbi:hypothetical protein EYF80_033411 [Liparis tanakae]|uniref:Uncharacterized protein n=1 Tax=Liparis tanakae TaxID=230148 RepID=A0A4Z2GTE1_9TELE|nr:hypothetical protein EYF80_033411 [Liparis tanakae]
MLSWARTNSTLSMRPEFAAPHPLELAASYYHEPAKLTLGGFGPLLVFVKLAKVSVIMGAEVVRGPGSDPPPDPLPCPVQTSTLSALSDAQRAEGGLNAAQMTCHAIKLNKLSNATFRCTG